MSEFPKEIKNPESESNELNIGKKEIKEMVKNQIAFLREFKQQLNSIEDNLPEKDKETFGVVKDNVEFLTNRLEQFQQKLLNATIKDIDSLDNLWIAYSENVVSNFVTIVHEGQKNIQEYKKQNTSAADLLEKNLEKLMKEFKVKTFDFNPDDKYEFKKRLDERMHNPLEWYDGDDYPEVIEILGSGIAYQNQRNDFEIITKSDVVIHGSKSYAEYFGVGAKHYSKEAYENKIKKEFSEKIKGKSLFDPELFAKLSQAKKDEKNNLVSIYGDIINTVDKKMFLDMLISEIKRLSGLLSNENFPGNTVEITMNNKDKTPTTKKAIENVLENLGVKIIRMPEDKTWDERESTVPEGQWIDGEGYPQIEELLEKGIVINNWAISKAKVRVRGDIKYKEYDDGDLETDKIINELFPQSREQ